MRKILLSALSALTVAAASASVEVPVMEESFLNARSTTIQGGYFAESLYLDAADCDLSGWQSKDVYLSERAAKFSAKTKTGWMVSPPFTLTQEEAAVIVRFRAQRWNTGSSIDETDLLVKLIVNGATVSTHEVSLSGSENVSDRNLDRFEVEFEDVPSGAQIRFEPSGSSVARLFLSDISVCEEMDESEVPFISLEQTYHHFDNLMAGNDSEVKFIKYDLVNCSGLEILASDGDQPNSFSLTDDGNGTISVSFTPANAGDKEERYLLKAGDVTRPVILTGKCKVYRPVAAEPSALADHSFVANWQPAPGMDSFNVVVWTEKMEAPVAADLMITKYIEGSSNNRALEIYNGTGEDLSLDGYALRMEANGAGGLTSGEFLLPDVTLCDGETYTICNAQYSDLRDIADKTIGYQDGGYNNITVFTGDDAIGLFNPAGELIDIVGYENMDQNDQVSGDFGADVSLYRKPTAYTGHDKYYPEEWDAYAKDYSEGYGSHSFDAQVPVRHIVGVFSVPAGETSLLVGDLASGTTYRYAVQGISSGLKTHYSAPADALTTGDSGVDEVLMQLPADGKAYNLNGVQVDLDKLAPGIYVIGGKKVVVK